MFENDVISACEKYSGSPFLKLMEYRTKAKLYPNGELAFWIKERFEYLDKIKDGSSTGQRWINDGCPDLFENDFTKTVSWNAKDACDRFFNIWNRGELTVVESGDKDKYKYIKVGIDDFICKYLEYRVIDGIVKDLQYPVEAKKFETTLTDPDRAKLCDDLISEAKSDILKKRIIGAIDSGDGNVSLNIKNIKKRFIGNVDRPTLMYLLGGDCPEKIIKIQMAGRHQNVYDLLFGISDHKNKDGGRCLPNFVKDIFCPTILLDKNGKDIPKLNNSTKRQD